MGKVILLTLLGLAILSGGIYAGYLFISSLNSGGNPFLFLLSGVLVVAGAYLLYRSAQEDIHKIHMKHSGDDHPSYQSAEGNVVERNNKLVSDWAKTVDTHSRLKTLKLSAESQEKAANGQ